MKVRIGTAEIRKCLDIETPDFPKYVRPLINLANYYAHGTRPRVVGQMSDLIQQFTGKTLPEWERWYLAEKPEAIKAATEKILQKLGNFRNALNEIDEAVVEQWVRDLVVVKTFVGLRFHEAVLKKAAELKNTTCRLSNREEEARGIDGYIGDIPLSIKPHTYRAKAALREHIGAKIVYYRKVDDGIEVDYGEVF